LKAILYVLCALRLTFLEVDDLVDLDPEGHPPVTGDVQAPCALAVAGQNVRFPCGLSG